MEHEDESQALIPTEQQTIQFYNKPLIVVRLADGRPGVVLRLLKRGAATWNTWREAHRDIQPDFAEADLTEANLTGADLTSADLTDARLIGASLVYACLLRADLSEANLTDIKGLRGHPQITSILCGSML